MSKATRRWLHIHLSRWIHQPRWRCTLKQEDVAVRHQEGSHHFKQIQFWTWCCWLCSRRVLLLRGVPTRNGLLCLVDCTCNMFPWVATRTIYRRLPTNSTRVACLSWHMMATCSIYSHLPAHSESQQLTFTPQCLMSREKDKQMCVICLHVRVGNHPKLSTPDAALMTIVLVVRLVALGHDLASSDSSQANAYSLSSKRHMWHQSAGRWCVINYNHTYACK